MGISIRTVALVAGIGVILAGCTRGVTPTEAAFLATIHGSGLDVTPIRIGESGWIGQFQQTGRARPRTTCRERIGPPPPPVYKTKTAGMVAFNRLRVNSDWVLDDYLKGWPDQMNLVAAMYFAHEMTHVWQWQNRDVTGYHPLKGAAEHKPGVDPYLFDPESNSGFLDFAYEQQASLVEEYVCCRTLDPGGARTERLTALLRQVMPVADPKQTPVPRSVRLPWDGAQIKGICS